MKTEARILNTCLGDIRRSRTPESLLLMRRYGLLQKEDVDGYSPERVERLEEVVPIDEDPQ